MADLVPEGLAAPSGARRRRRRTADAGRAVFEASISIVVMLIIWQLLVTIFDVPPFILPPPIDIVARTVDLLPLLVEHAWATLFEILVGFVAAVLGGVMIGIALAASPRVDRALTPAILFLQVIPKVAIAPILIVWLGTGVSSKVVLVFLIAFFPMVIQMVAGIKSVDERVRFLVRSTQAPWLTEFRKITLPHSLPYLFSGMRVAITLAVVGAIVAELVASTEGIGYLMLVAFGRLDTTLMMSGLLILSFMALGLYGLVALAESVVIPWHVSQRRRPE
jgi:NitT/TauT family transport system permease protein